MRPQFLITFAAFGILLTLSCSPASGLGIAILNQDSEAYARGNAFTATADNPSAIFYNPAGITQLPGGNIELGLYGVTYDSNVRPTAGGNFDTPNKLQSVPQFYATYTIPDTRFSFGLGVYSPFGLGSEYPDNTPFRSLATYAKLIYITANPVVAYKLTDTFSIAAGLTINYANADFRRGILVPGDEFRFGGDGFACGFTLGTMWQPAKQHSFGLMYRSATKMDLYGNVDVTSLTPYLFPSSRDRATAHIDFPQQIIAGYSFRPTPHWNLEADVNWTDWSQDENLTVREASGTNVLDAFGWHSEFTISAGVSYYFSNGFELSAGYFFCPGATPDDDYTPSVADTNLNCFTCGVEYHFQKHWRVGVAYGFAYGQDHTVTGSAPTAIGQTADGQYKFTGNAVSLAVGYSF
jgi:long-chain fatty acid transport protein